jgi:hypothetical protein
MKLSELLESDLTKQIKEMPKGEQIEVKVGAAILRMEKIGDHLLLRFIKSSEKGAGSRAMTELCKAADELKLPIELDVFPIPSHARKAKLKPLSSDELRAWYTKNGFKSIKGDLMRREPKVS